jgi:hypothetical protein
MREDHGGFGELPDTWIELSQPPNPRPPELIAVRLLADSKLTAQLIGTTIAQPLLAPSLIFDAAAEFRSDERRAVRAIQRPAGFSTLV